MVSFRGVPRRHFLFWCVTCAVSLTSPFSAFAQTAQGPAQKRQTNRITTAVRSAKATDALVVPPEIVELGLTGSALLPLPPNAVFQLGDSSVVSVSPERGGLLLRPIKAGSTSVVVRSAQGNLVHYLVRVTPRSAQVVPTSEQVAPLRDSGNLAIANQPKQSRVGIPGTGGRAPFPGSVSQDGLPENGAYEISGSPTEMAVFAVAVDAAELLTAVAARGGLNLIVDKDVSRRITVNIRNRPAHQIVRDIASAYGLSVAEIKNILMISEGIPRSPSSYLLSDIDAIPTQYVDAASARNLLPVFLQDYVKVNAEQNAVVLSAPPEILAKFRADIAQFDIPAAQILIDLLLVELTDTTLDQLNLSLSYANSGRGIFLNPSVGAVSYRAVTTLPDGFSASIRALEQQGKARVRANPRVATVSGQAASIFVGRQRYVVTPINTSRGQLNFIDAGVRLQITPYTGGQEQVLVDVDSEVSTLSALDPVTGLPEKSTRTANTVVRVGSGQTIVIGGLEQQEERSVRTKVPVLGDLPLVGGLFRGKDVRTTRSDLVLFITPRILSDSGHLPAAEERAMKEKFLAPLLPKTPVGRVRQ